MTDPPVDFVGELSLLDHRIHEINFRLITWYTRRFSFRALGYLDDTSTPNGVGKNKNNNMQPYSIVSNDKRILDEIVVPQKMEEAIKQLQHMIVHICQLVLFERTKWSDPVNPEGASHDAGYKDRSEHGNIDMERTRQRVISLLNGGNWGKVGLKHLKDLTKTSRTTALMTKAKKCRNQIESYISDMRRPYSLLNKLKEDHESKDKDPRVMFKALLLSIEKSLKGSDDLLLHAFNDKSSKRRKLDLLEVVTDSYVCYVGILVDLQAFIEEKNRQEKWPDLNIENNDTSLKIARVSVLTSYLKVSRFLLVEPVRMSVEKCFEEFDGMLEQFRTFLVDVEKTAGEAPLLKPSYSNSATTSSRQIEKPSNEQIKEPLSVGLMLDANEACDSIIKMFFEWRVTYDEAISKFEVDANEDSDMLDKSKALLEDPGFQHRLGELELQLQDASKLLQTQSQRMKWLIRRLPQRIKTGINVEVAKSFETIKPVLERSVSRQVDSRTVLHPAAAL